MNKLFIIFTILCCLFSLSQSYTLVCGEGESQKLNTNRQLKCVPNEEIIPNCLIYNADDESKCTECVLQAVVEGTTPNITACDCSATPHLSKTKDSDKVCVQEIENCTHYHPTNFDKCYFCITGANTSGSPNEYDSCNCTGKPHFVKDQNGVDHCVANLIPNCEKYNQSDDTKCHICKNGATPNAAAGSITECDCGSKTFMDGIDQNGIGICIENENKIDNCKVYSSSDLSKCNECIPNAYPDANPPNTTACSCDAPRIVSVDQNGDSVCISDSSIVVGCAAYNSEMLSRCHSCAEGFEPAAEEKSPRIANCQCISGSYLGYTENQEAICVENEINGCKYYANSDKTKCHTCHTNYVPTGGSQYLYESCDCSGGKVEGIDQDSNPICVTNEVTGCKTYNKDNADQCTECYQGYVNVGESPSITECNCESPSFGSIVDNKNKIICVSSGSMIDNCIMYNSVQLSRCHTCILGADTNGRTSPFILDCECESPSSIKETENSGEKVCVANKIQGCLSYNSAHITKCHTCTSGFTGEGMTENEYTGCNCTNDSKIPGVDELGNDVCGANIENCEIFNSGNPDVCYSCIAPFQGNSNNNDHTECQCPVGQTTITDQYGNTHCAVEISDCDVYKTSDRGQCYTCSFGYEKANGDTECVCSNSVQDENGNQICVSNVIEHCLQYSSSDKTKCYSCKEGANSSGNSNAYDACYCPRKGEKSDGSEICLDEQIQNCVNYLNPGACNECEPGFEKNEGNGQCECPQDKNKMDLSGQTICVESVIEACQYYLNRSECQECQKGFLLSVDNLKCESNLNEGFSSSGFLIQFSILILLILSIFLF